MKNKVYPWKGARSILINTSKRGCDGKEHPKFNYRPYRRGYNRCKVCGGALSFAKKLVDTHYQEVPFLKMIAQQHDKRLTNTVDIYQSNFGKCLPNCDCELH